MKKIAFFQKDLGSGGIQKSLINVLNVIADNNKIDLYLYSSKNDFYEDKVPKSVNIIYLKSKKIYNLIPFSFFNYLNKKKYMNKEYDIAVDYNGYQNDTACGAINVKSKKKIIWIHSDIERRYFYEKKYRYLFKMGKTKYSYFDSFVFVSEGVKSGFLKKIPLKSKKMTVISNIIDDEIIQKRANEKCDLIVDKNKYNIISVGRMVRAKGFDLLLHDIKRLLKYRQDFHLYLIGNGEEYEKLLLMTQELELDNYVTFLGSQTNPYKYMQLMDGFVLTSRYEGQGMVIMEAKALGLSLFISKHLEKYNNDEFKGYSDIVDGLKNAQKKEKKKNSLANYNRSILKKIHDVLS